MSRADRTVNLVGVVLPVVGLVTAVVLLWNRAVGLVDLALLASSCAVVGLGVTVGFHRVVTHRAFPRFAAHGLRRTELDSSAWVIAGMEWLGLARGVVRIAEDRQRSRASGGP